MPGQWRGGNPDRIHKNLFQGSEGESMATDMPKTGIDVIGDIAAWGTHFCLFYETKEDFFDTVISYCKSGLESEEDCLWIVAEPLTIEETTDELRDAVPELDRHLEDSNLEPASARDWFQKDGMFEVSPSWTANPARQLKAHRINRCLRHESATM